MIKVKKDTPANMKEYIKFLQQHHGYSLQNIWDYKNPFTKDPNPLKDYLHDILGK